MNIAFLTSEYPKISKRYGGIATSIQNMAKAFIKEKGNNVTIFLYGSNIDEIIYEENIKIIKIAKLKTKFLSWYFNRKKAKKIINKEIKNSKIDIIEAYDWTGITAFMKLDAPIILKLHGSDSYFCHIEKREQKYKNFFFEKIAFKQADAILSVSNYTGGLTNKIFKQNRDFKVIYNGVDISLFKAQEKLNSENIILYFGTLIRKKGVLELPFIFRELLKEVKNAKLILVGADAFDIKTGSKSTWELIKKEFSKEELKQVEYKGKIPYEEMNKTILNSSVIVFPSFAEAFPMSWLEAMASKKAIVGSNMPWSNEAIENRVSGFLIDPKNHQEFAKSISNLILDINLRKKIENEAKKRVDNLFELSKIVEQHKEYYRKIIEENKK